MHYTEVLKAQDDIIDILKQQIEIEKSKVQMYMELVAELNRLLMLQQSIIDIRVDKL